MLQTICYDHAVPQWVPSYFVSPICLKITANKSRILLVMSFLTLSTFNNIHEKMTDLLAVIKYYYRMGCYKLNVRAIKYRCAPYPLAAHTRPRAMFAKKGDEIITVIIFSIPQRCSVAVT